MDALYFNTKNKEGVLTELGVPLDAPTFYDSGKDWICQWVGKMPKTTETRIDNEGQEYEHVIEWQEGEFFNIYLIGQDNMDYFTKSLKSAKQILPDPRTPQVTLL